MMVERDVDFTEEVVAPKPVAVPDHYTQRPRLQFTLRNVILRHSHNKQHVSQVPAGLYTYILYSPF